MPPFDRTIDKYPAAVLENATIFYAPTPNGSGGFVDSHTTLSAIATFLGGMGGGATSLLGLSDTPVAYPSAVGGKVYRMQTNALGNGVEFIELTSANQIPAPGAPPGGAEVFGVIWDVALNGGTGGWAVTDLALLGLGGGANTDGWADFIATLVLANAGRGVVVNAAGNNLELAPVVITHGICQLGFSALPSGLLTAKGADASGQMFVFNANKTTARQSGTAFTFDGVGNNILVTAGVSGFFQVSITFTYSSTLAVAAALGEQFIFGLRLANTVGGASIRDYSLLTFGYSEPVIGGIGDAIRNSVTLKGQIEILGGDTGVARHLGLFVAGANAIGGAIGTHILQPSSMKIEIDSL